MEYIMDQTLLSKENNRISYTSCKYEETICLSWNITVFSALLIKHIGFGFFFFLDRYNSFVLSFLNLIHLQTTKSINSELES